MLRYNNQTAISKPVDYYRPLTVDVSVEYELPNSYSAPPPGSAPLLIIHPSVYFRSKVNQTSSSSSSSSASPLSSGASHKNVSSLSHRASRHDPAMSSSSSLYYLTSNPNSNKGSSSSSSSRTVAGGHHNNQNLHLTSNHIKSLRHGSSHLSGSITRSRSAALNGSGDGGSTTARGSMNISNCPYGKYDEYSNTNSSGNNGNIGGVTSLVRQCETGSGGDGGMVTSTSSNNVSVRGGGSSSAMKKVSMHPMDRLSYNFSNNSMSSGGGNNNNNLSANVHGPGSSFGVSTNPTTIGSTATTMTAGINFGGSSTTTSNISGTASNKRLRMMNQHQSTMHNNPPQQPMEPLNLAITPSASNSLLNPPYHNNIHLSTFFNSNYKPSNNNNVTGLGLNYGSTFPNNHRSTSNPTTASQNLYAAQSTRFPKECPVPLDKDCSGSDSGVCSENDSDVSPPMAAPFSGHARRSIQELPTSGCYCCCCPTTTSSSSSRKGGSSTVSSSHLKGKSSISSSQQSYHPLGANNSNLSKLSQQGGGSLMQNNNNNSSGNNSNSSGSLLNYGMSSINSTINMSMMAIHHGGHMSIESLGSSPLDLDSTYRKWFVASNCGVGVGPAWFQV